MTLLLLVALGQAADGLSYLLAHGHGQELNGGMATLIGAHGPDAIAGGKVVAGIALMGLAYPVRHRRRLLLGLTAVGFVGALTNLLGSIG